MHRQSRIPLWLGLFLCAALLLCLAALVETPADATAAPRPVFLVVQFETALPLAPEPLAAGRPQWEGHNAMLPLLLALAALALPSATRDANGRVLRRRHYVKCYYPLFRLELAAG
ncbi:MAG: hypothetical protein VB087_09275 [Candidatus Limiplasma sp.]|nr:hypothetical protein [Candidatus Limiplasma sp.]MEA5144417.1 hypothetical protein [Candidatus Limiplasma sp.]